MWMSSASTVGLEVDDGCKKYPVFPFSLLLLIFPLRASHWSFLVAVNPYLLCVSAVFNSFQHLCLLQLFFLFCCSIKLYNVGHNRERQYCTVTPTEILNYSFVFWLSLFSLAESGHGGVNSFVVDAAKCDDDDDGGGDIAGDTRKSYLAQKRPHKTKLLSSFIFAKRNVREQERKTRSPRMLRFSFSGGVHKEEIEY